MATLVVNSSTADGSARASSTTYATARAMTSPTAYTAEIGDPVGQTLVSTTYTCYQLFLDFDTSSLTAGATISAVTLELYLRTDSSTTDFTANAYIHDWGATFTTADVVAGASLGALTLVATLASSGIGAANAYKTFTDVAFPANINKTGTTRIIIASSRQAGNNTPTNAEWMDFALADNGSNQPKLTVTYTPAGTNATAEHIAATGAAYVAAPKVAPNAGHAAVAAAAYDATVNTGVTATNAAAESAAATGAAYNAAVSVKASAASASATGAAYDATVSGGFDDGEVLTRIDWTNSGAFSGALDTIRVPIEVRISRGVNSDYSGEAIGSASLTIKNDDDYFTPDRNWADNPSFEYGTTGWETTASTGLTAAATSISQVTDNATDAGTKAGEAVLTASSGSGVHYPIPYRFRSGKTYTVGFYLKSASGTLSVQCGIASSGTVADIATAAGTITTSWAAYSVTWTPSADRTDAVLFVRTTTASAATVRIDRIQLNPGSALNTYLEAPTKGQLIPGRPVHISGYYNGTARPKFFGYIERITPNSVERIVRIECYDVLKRLSETDVVIAATTGYTPTGRDMRVAVLADAERGNVNLLSNPSFETNTTGWTQTGTSLTRSASDPAPGGGSAHAAFAASAGAQVAYISAGLAPVYFEDETYHASVYLRVTSGTANWTLILGTGITVDAATTANRVVTVTTTWQRFDVSYTLPTTVTAENDPLRLTILSTASGTVRIDNAAITRGQALYPYAATGTGRYPSFLANGSFDGGTTGWYEAWSNLLSSNPSFETNTTGWSATGDAFHSTGAIARTTSAAYYGSASLELTAADSGDGAHFTITGTFTSGVTYDWGVRMKKSTAGTWSAEAGIGSQGTPADVSTNVNTIATNDWLSLAGSWTPSSNRTDAHFYVQDNTGGGNVTYWDGAYVFRRGTGHTASPSFVNVGPGTTGGVASTVNRSSDIKKYGYASLTSGTAATATSGVAYDFFQMAPRFASGQPYTFSVWVYPTSSFPYKLGIAGDKLDGTYDEASATGTATANTWTQISVTWTPSADRSTVSAWDVVGYLWQTDTTSRTVYIDGARCIAGSAVDDFELSRWDLDAAGEATDIYASTANLSGTALGSLSTLNTLGLTRHWIVPTASGYTYKSEDRDTFAAKSSVATFDGDDIVGVPEFTIERSGIANLVGVSWTDSNDAVQTSYYSDEDSITAYGVRPGSTIAGQVFFDSRTVPDSVGPAYVTRLKDSRYRPQVQRVNDYSNQMTLDLNDIVTVDADRPLIISDEYVIVREELVITAPRLWVTTWALEQNAY